MWLAMRTEAEGSPLLEATAKQQLVKTEQTKKTLCVLQQSVERVI
jgi:hypothetical protein